MIPSRPSRFVVSSVMALSILFLSALQALALGAQATLAPLDVVVSEIAWMGTAAAATDEWIELYNNSASPIDLTGWTLAAADGTPAIALAGSIPAHSYYLLERSDDTTVPEVPMDLHYTGALGNEGEDLVLRDNGANVIDRVNCSTGWFAGHNDARVPMVRIDLSGDGSQSSNWTYNPRCGSPTNSAGVSHTCVLTTTTVGHALGYSVYFNERFTATVTTTTTTPMESALLSLIESADMSIDIAFYGLNRQWLVGKLIDLHANHGITVRAVGDDEAASGEYATWYQQLVDAGITVVVDTSTSKIQHNKFLVVDGQVVWTGSTNFTDTGFTLNANVTVQMVYETTRTE